MIFFKKSRDFSEFRNLKLSCSRFENNGNATRVCYGMSKKFNLPCPIPSGSSPLDRVIYISKDAFLNVEYDANCFQSKFVTEEKV